MEKALFDIFGMTCSACSARIEKGVAKLSGIDSVSVNLLTNSMAVEFDSGLADIGKIVKTVEDLGYGASQKAAAKNKQAPVNTAKICEEQNVIMR